MLDTRTEALPRIADELRHLAPPPAGVLSVYLDMSPGQMLKQAHLLAFRDACKQIRADILPEQLTRFEPAVAQAERYLIGHPAATAPGLALFASGSGGYFYAVPLPRHPRHEVAWGDRPLFAPLDEMLAECDRVAVLLFDSERARIFSIYLDHIEQHPTIADDVPGKQATGDWFALSQGRYERHREYHLAQHARRAIAAMLTLLRDHPYDRLVLGGPPEALALLQHHLPQRLRARLAGTTDLELFASDAEVLRAATAVAEAARQREERAVVEELIEAASTLRAELGLKPVLAALNARRVYRLILSVDFDTAGGECDACGSLVSGRDRCPVCSGTVRQIGDLRERLVDRAMEQGARVELVAGEAATLLLPYDGIAAWTRY